MKDFDKSQSPPNEATMVGDIIVGQTAIQTAEQTGIDVGKQDIEQVITSGAGTAGIGAT
jgi:hypothetical protein